MIGERYLGEFILPQSAKLSEYVRGKLSVMRCHDWDHTERVLRNAREIVRLESAEEWLPVIEVAVLLHDIARPDELRSGGTVCHAVLGAEKVPSILREFGYDDGLTEAVCLCVRRHRYRSEDAPQSVAEKIVYDADKLDAIGAVGIARAYYFSGRQGARLHNTTAEALAAPDYSSEDTAWREYLVKCRHIPDRMCTVSGRELAKKRHAFSVLFYDMINWEVLGIPPSESLV